MNTKEIMDLYSQYVIPTYAPSLVLTKGRGAKVWDAEGREYLDFLCGISVSNLGHCHPEVVKAVKRQAAKLMHVSNLYYNEHQPRLAKALSEKSLGGKCFFCNSGAEANEALIKLARLWGHPQGRYEIISMKNAFHGRTLATLTASGQAKVKKGFDPLPSGFVEGTFNDLESCRALIHERTAAIMVEAIQGEGGANPAERAFMQGLRALCDEHNLLLLCDEIQCGMGRTGDWFGYQAYDIEPDAISLAKGLGGGFPIGAIVTAPKYVDIFQPGSHGSTFGGTPLACAAALAIVQTIERNQLLEHAKNMGALFMSRMEKPVKKYSFLKEIRGMGLMIGLVLNEPAQDFEALLRKKGLLTVATAASVIRLLPPLNVTKSQVNTATRIIKEACKEWQRT